LNLLNLEGIGDKKGKKKHLAEKVDKMDIKYTIIFHCKTFQIGPNWDFGFENVPSGNTVSESYRAKLKC
jgi:hypothetical protein